MKNVFLGIDTSNYTTSLALFCENEFVCSKKGLFVRSGEKGVRQSEAVFQHTKNIPELMEDVFSKARAKFGEDLKISAVGVSQTPRRREGSYMPCFLAGVASASSIAFSHDVPLYRFSHQEGHIRAAILGSGFNSSLSRFYSFHLSGGTCELLSVEKDNIGYCAEIISDSADITLGQLIDRTGVLLGLDFPCGPELEKLAEKSLLIPDVSIKSTRSINLSGFENKVQKMIEIGTPAQDVASFVFGVCVSAVRVMLENAEEKLPILFSGGGSSSHILAENVLKFSNAYFAPPVYSADNAIGIAALCQDNVLRR
mgnify:CR=1 FL=1